MMALSRTIPRLWQVAKTPYPRWLIPGRNLTSLTSLPTIGINNANRHQFHFNTQANSTHNINAKWKRTKLLCATAGSCLFVAFSFNFTAFCGSKQHSSNTTSAVARLPQLTLYQYQTCPFCCKARAYLDFYDIPYSVVEVNPLFKKEIKFSEYKKVPFIVSADGVQINNCFDLLQMNNCFDLFSRSEFHAHTYLPALSRDLNQINDSSVLISVLQTFVCNGGSEGLASILDKYPEVSSTDSKGKTQTERANKYFIMFGERGESEGISLAERREEREWREWVDSKLIHVLSPNIYRTPSEALQAFDYMSRVGNFGTVQRLAAKYVGACTMYFLSKTLKKKYKLKEDVRESLYDHCRQWTEAVGKERVFMGGHMPNLADLAVYGVLSSIEGLPAFKDMMKYTDMASWYWKMKKLVNNENRSA